jgi:hypothetical protein
VKRFPLAVVVEFEPDDVVSVVVAPWFVVVAVDVLAEVAVAVSVYVPRTRLPDPFFTLKPDDEPVAVAVAP